MKSRRTKQSHKLFARLPLPVQQEAIESYQLFRPNPYHPSLQFKQIDPQDPIYSVRIGRNIVRLVGTRMALSDGIGLVAMKTTTI